MGCRDSNLCQLHARQAPYWCFSNSSNLFCFLFSVFFQPFCFFFRLKHCIIFCLFCFFQELVAVVFVFFLVFVLFIFGLGALPSHAKCFILALHLRIAPGGVWETILDARVEPESIMCRQLYLLCHLTSPICN